MTIRCDYLHFSGVDKQPFKEQNVDGNGGYKIDGKKARSIAQDLTKETVSSLKLTHSGRYIIYTIVTQSRVKHHQCTRWYCYTKECEMRSLFFISICVFH